MSKYSVVERLDKISLAVVLKSLVRYSDRFSITVPVSGYEDVDLRLINEKSMEFSEWIIDRRLLEVDIFSVQLIYIKACAESIEKLISIGSTPERWSWAEGFPEDIILYRKNSDLVLFESYIVDKLNFAILEDSELPGFLKDIGGPEGRKILSLERELSKKNLWQNQPRLLNAVEGYQELEQ